MLKLAKQPAPSTPVRYRVPFNQPSFGTAEEAYLRRALDGRHFSGDGEYTRRCSTLLEQSLSVPKALLTTSCTHALEMAALLLDIQPGDEVIVPTFTFVSTINAFVLRGARPVFVDIRPDTLNLDERLLPFAVTDRTRVIVPVHYAGVGCEMDVIMQIADKLGLGVVEDNAHALYARYRGRYLGTFGQLATQSFHETKNFSCGEGGALLINDARLIARAEILREKGTDRSRFFRGQVDKYTWVDVGSSYLPSDLLAAILLAQLEQREAIQRQRHHIWHRYHAALADWAAAQNIQLPFVPEHCEQSYHMFYMLLPDLETRTRFINHMKDRRILSVFHYYPLHLSAEGTRLGGRRGQCPVAEDASDRLVRLPFFRDLSEADLDFTIEAVLEFGS